jgi:hypothetical protein
MVKGSAYTNKKDQKLRSLPWVSCGGKHQKNINTARKPYSKAHLLLFGQITVCKNLSIMQMTRRKQVDPRIFEDWLSGIYGFANDQSYNVEKY